MKGEDLTIKQSAFLEAYYDPESECVIAVVPDWKTRLTTLKLILSLLPDGRKKKILDGLKLRDEDITSKLNEAIIHSDKDALRWGMQKKRFFILQRDSFTCQYCGRKAPEVVLQVDHIKPIIKGGDNRNNNLITSCRDCNLGKGTSEYIKTDN